MNGDHVFRCPRLLSATLVIVLTATVVLTTNAPSHAASQCSNELRTEAGTCAKPVAAEPLTLWQTKRAGELNRLLDQAKKRVQRGQFGWPLIPNGWELPEVAKMRIFREGEGNGRKSYTCGPSAARNVLAAIYKRKTGVYRDFGEAQLASWMGTTERGTARLNLARALNKHFKNLESWRTYRPADKVEYMLAVQLSTTQVGRSVIANVDTKFLAYFSGVQLKHFNFVYGYVDTQTKHRLRIGEEWDPKYVYGALADKYKGTNPYGKQVEAIGAAFAAISTDPIHGIVR